MGPASFHCQQIVEKALKGFLVSRGHGFDKVHTLAYLFDLCESLEPAFSEVRDGAEPLTHFAVGQRYPSAHRPPSEEEVEDFLAAAEKVLDLVLARLGPDQP